MSMKKEIHQSPTNIIGNVIIILKEINQENYEVSRVFPKVSPKIFFYEECKTIEEALIIAAELGFHYQQYERKAEIKIHNSAVLSFHAYMQR